MQDDYGFVTIGDNTEGIAVVWRLIVIKYDVWTQTEAFRSILELRISNVNIYSFWGQVRQDGTRRVK